MQKAWNDLPAPKAKEVAARPDCERLRDLVVRLRSPLKANVKKLSAPGISPGSQPLVLWKNQQQASRRRSYSGDVRADMQALAEQLNRKEDGLKPFFAIPENVEVEGLRKALTRFCYVFPDAFFLAERGPYFNPNATTKGRLLTAGFHLMQGYFRDDRPLCELILAEHEGRELDELWDELNFITQVPMRQYQDFIFFERAEPPRFLFDSDFDFARSEDRGASSEAKMSRLAKLYLAKAKDKGAGAEALEAIAAYFTGMSGEIRRIERARLDAEPTHLKALVDFAQRAYRRPLAAGERETLLALYRKFREKDELAHEDASRDTLVTILLSPHFCYRLDLGSKGRTASAKVQDKADVQPLAAYELANRLSYFLWSSMPDNELLARAAAGDLTDPEVLRGQTRRLLRDTKMRGLATEFGGNWLDFRRFEEHNAVDRERFPTFTNELRQAMFEEPVRYFIDMATRNRSVLDLLYGKDTFVNPLLAKHYGLAWPASKPTDAGEWLHVEDAGDYGRGGLLAMAVFLTRNAPGLRTSPVKRGYWVVRRLLGEQIPPPPPTVPELPKDEANTGALTLPQLLARHRADKSCSGCHQRFDAVGLVFEGFGPVGERRVNDLGGRPVASGALFPDGKERAGLQGLRAYLREKRQGDFVDNLCKKMFAYALGRTLLPSDTKALASMREKLLAADYAFGALVEEIVLSPQFLKRRSALE